MRQVAINSLGYEVQWLTKEGWKSWDDIVHKNLYEAQKRLNILKLITEGNFEMRVYEVLEDIQ